jgi:hypothetical protein
LDTGIATFPENDAIERLRTLAPLRSRLLLFWKSYAGPPLLGFFAIPKRRWFESNTLTCWRAALYRS